MDCESIPLSDAPTLGEPKLAYTRDTQSEAALCDGLQGVLESIGSGQLVTSDAIRQALVAVVGVDSTEDLPQRAAQILAQIHQRLGV